MADLREKFLETTGKDLGPLEKLILVDIAEEDSEDLSMITLDISKRKKYLSQ